MPELTLSSLSELTALGSVRNPQQITNANARPRRHAPAITDVMTVTSDPKVHAHMEGLFHRFGWSVALVSSGAAAVAFAKNNLAAVALCSEDLPDGTWKDVARAFHARPYSPVLIVIGEDKSILSQVTQMGGFDVLTQPFNQTDVLWAVASAWHAWMTAYEELYELSSRLEEVAG